MKGQIHPWVNHLSRIDTREGRLLNVVQGPWSRVGTTVESPLLGHIHVEHDQVLDFVDPIAGFPGCRRYALLPYRQSGRVDPDMHWLQALQAPFHTFLVTDAWSADIGYEPEIDHMDVEALGIGSFESLALYAIVTVSRRTNELTANLRAPLVVSGSAPVARQVVLRNGALYDTRHRICDLP